MSYVILLSDGFLLAEETITHGSTQSSNSECTCDMMYYRFTARADLAKAVVLCSQRCWQFCEMMVNYLNFRVYKYRRIKCYEKCQDHLDGKERRWRYNYPQNNSSVCSSCFSKYHITLVLHPRLYADLDYSW